MRVVLDTNILARASYSFTGPASESLQRLKQPEHVLILSSYIYPSQPCSTARSNACATVDIFVAFRVTNLDNWSFPDAAKPRFSANEQFSRQID